MPECEKINDGQSELYVDSGSEFAWYAFAKKRALDTYSEEKQIDGTLVIAFTNWDDTTTKALALNNFKRCTPSYIIKMLQEDGDSV